MFNFLRSAPEESLYLYLEPKGEGDCSYQLLNDEELEEKYAAGDLNDGCRLFKIEKEIKVTFERVIHLD